MRIYQTVKLERQTAESAVALGYFDGLHIGHKAVIEKAVDCAKGRLEPWVFSFTIHDRQAENRHKGNDIMTVAQKHRLLESWGVQAVLMPDFSEIREMSPEQFLDDILVDRLRVSVICCGHDFRFGRFASAGVQELLSLCNDRGIELYVVPAVKNGGARISSTRIRALLEAGDIPQAVRLLGHPFGYDFQVVHGKRLGRTIEAPTINQPFPEQFVRLRHGVYASRTFASGKWYASVTNVGVRPTVERSDNVNSETYIHGFAGDLYGQRVQVELLCFLRPEQAFASIEELKAQIHADAKQALELSADYRNV